MSDEAVECPCFPCIWKSCKSTFTKASPCYERTTTGRQTHVITCEACLHSYELYWVPDKPKARVPVKLIAPWEPEGKRLLVGYGLYDQADPRVYERGVVPDKYRTTPAPRGR